jgi:hypothetical protein
MDKWCVEREGDLLAHIEDSLRNGDFEMSNKMQRLSDTAAARGFRIDAVWHSGVICFDLVRLSDEVMVLECVGSMDIERYFEEY